MIKAVIFDLDGTLVDSVALHAQAWVKAFKNYGYEFSFEELREQIGKGDSYIIQDLLSESDAKQSGEQITNYRKEYFQNNYLEQVRPFPKVKELLKKIEANNLKIILASSAKTDTIEHYKQLLEIEDLIDGATSADDVEKAKPEPDIFLAALKKIDGITANEAIVIGDSPYDIQAANKASLSTIGLLSGGFTQEKLTEAGCIAIYQDPADLLANYDSSPLKK